MYVVQCLSYSVHTYNIHRIAYTAICIYYNDYCIHYYNGYYLYDYYYYNDYHYLDYYNYYTYYYTYYYTNTYCK